MFTYCHPLILTSNERSRSARSYGDHMNLSRDVEEQHFAYSASLRLSYADLYGRWPSLDNDRTSGARKDLVSQGILDRHNDTFVFYRHIRRDPR